MTRTIWIDKQRGLSVGPTRKHLQSLLRNSTPKKLANLLRCEWEVALKREKVKSRPYILKLDVTNACNLKCPGCPTGLGQLGRSKSLLSPDAVRDVLKEVGDYAYIAHLYNWGEPFLNKNLPEIVALVSDANIYTSVSTHLSITNFNRIEASCRAGLDHLIVGLDGVNAEQYSKYRRGGDFELVLENLKRLRDLKTGPNPMATTIEIQTLAFGFIEQDLERAYELACEFKADWFRARPPIAPEKHQPKLPKLRGSHRGLQKPCAMPWRYLAVQADGGVSACCNTFNKADDFGDLEVADLTNLRNNDRFRAARRLVTADRWAKKPPNPDHPCLRCPVLHHQAHGAKIRDAYPKAQASKSTMAIAAYSAPETQK